MKISELSEKVSLLLSDTEDGGFDGMCILEDIGGITRERAALHPDDELHESICARVIEAANKRKSGYPLQYILGQWEFYGLRFRVGEGVLIPRPDTEALAEEAIGRIKKQGAASPRIIDLCSGSGCIAVTLAKLIEGSEVFAVELSGEAFPYLTDNIRSNDARVTVIRGDVSDGRLLDNFRDEDGEIVPVDCIVSNPPYLTSEEMAELQTEVGYEPEIALFGGNDGLKFYRIITCLWKVLLTEGGLLIFEIGNDQEGAVTDILINEGFGDIFTAPDATGAIRVVGGYYLG